MVTVHHQQSGLEPPPRVVIDSSNLSSSELSDVKVAREFTAVSRKFSVIERPSPHVIAHARAEIQSGNTAAIIPPDVMSPDAVFFDMDATVIAEESLVEIAKAAGKENEILALTEKAMAGGMDFKESLQSRLRILKGLPRQQILSIQPTINPGMLDLADWLRTQDIPMFLVSGGFVDLAGPLARQLGFKDFKANHFAWSGDLMAGKVEGEILDARGKQDAVQEWCKIYNLNPKRCVAVGDGANDLAMMALCGLAVGFSPKKTLWPHLSVLNATGSHRFLLEALSK